MDQKKYNRIPQSNKITNNIHCSIINLSINGLSSPIKRHRLMNWIRKQDPPLYHLNETWPVVGTRLYCERMERSIPTKWKWFSNLSGTHTLTPMSTEGRHVHWWTDSSWKMLVSSPVCIILLYSKSTRWREQTGMWRFPGACVVISTGAFAFQRYMLQLRGASFCGQVRTYCISTDFPGHYVPK